MTDATTPPCRHAADAARTLGEAYAAERAEESLADGADPRTLAIIGHGQAVLALAAAVRAAGKPEPTIQAYCSRCDKRVAVTASGQCPDCPKILVWR